MNSNIDSKLRRAAALHGQGDPVRAAVLYKEILRTHPEHPDALHLLGVAETQLGRAQQGMNLIAKSLATNAHQPVAIANHGNALMALNRSEEALADYDRALELWPDYVLAHFGRGNALSALGRPVEALVSLERTLELIPGFIEALNSRGTMLLKVKRPEDALDSFDRLLALSPGHPEALTGRGHALAELGRTDAAIDAYGQALQRNPDLGVALFSQGVALSMRGRYREATPLLQRLKRLDPHYAYASGAYFHAQLQLCDWTDYREAMNDIVASMERENRADFPFSFLAVCDSPVRQLRCARQFSAVYRTRQQPLWTGEHYAHERIRVAYISADYLEHPTSYLMAGVFEKHDRRRFETIGISLREDEQSPTARRVKAAFERYIVADSRSDLQIARLIRELEVDIAVDLMGYTGEHRSNLFSHRAAPIQVNYLGFPATMGTADIDYLLADEFLIPRDHQADYEEQVVYLPECFQANDDRKITAAGAPTRSDVGLPPGFVWCSFHSSYKLNPPMFDVWTRLLRAVPGSVLWLLGGNPEVEHNLRREATARGVDVERLVFAKSRPYPEHLARLPLADLYLDTLPFNGGATTSDALWAGVPVVTCAGRSFAARMSGSLLRALEMPELITDTLQDYEQLALQLARTPQRLTDLRAKLANKRTTAPPFDTD
jgi:protein O-GlcNAc transferase